MNIGYLAATSIFKQTKSYQKLFPLMITVGNLININRTGSSVFPLMAIRVISLV